jgi:hypothetical protein
MSDDNIIADARPEKSWARRRWRGRIRYRAYR